jgi:hypothetical protein
MELSELDLLDDPPSLGYLDEALNFIAAERAIAAQKAQSAILRGGGAAKGGTSSSESAWRHVVQPRRTRRRKRPKTIRILRKASSDSRPTQNTVMTGKDQDENEDSSSSSSLDDAKATYLKSTPGTPPKRKFEKEKQRAITAGSNPRLRQSRSTPTLRIPLTNPPDPETLHLRTLAHKLRMLFPADAASLTAILYNDPPDTTVLHDPVFQSQDTLIHVFIDQYVCTATHLLPSSTLLTTSSPVLIFLSVSLII